MMGPTTGKMTTQGLSGRRGLLVGMAATAAAIALALGQHWLAVADLVPLLVVLPCTVMMFHCMKGMNRGEQTDAAQAAPQNPASTLPASEAKAIEPTRWAG